MLDLTGANWHTSPRSGDSGNCVEVACVVPEAPGIVAVRDSKDRGGAVVVIADSEWAAFIAEVKASTFDL
ncbi:DUF397 domain-containing protein [Dactylosporangium sp. NPDC051541]|uniref:DUF397 domain-containing protein n=1 Tax=Dactylosporangium sp. NPDC051541 TaxID=3363977 RepID=UPI0037A3805A